jgi:3-phenylpropionate/cinnamic acid dioxygenase small subunit
MVAIMHSDDSMYENSPVSLEEWYEIERFLMREARWFDSERQRQWLRDMVHPDINYKLVVRQERFRSDKSAAADREVLVYDDRFADLDLRIKQFETGKQAMLDPPQVLIRAVSNIEAAAGGAKGTYHVRSYCTVHRARREYERSISAFEKNDVIVRGDDGRLRLTQRHITLGQRVVTDKNLLYFI